MATGGVSPSRNRGRRSRFSGFDADIGPDSKLWGKYDPAIWTELQAGERGLRAFIREMKLQNKREKKDYKGDIRTTNKAKRDAMGDLADQLQRGREDFSTQRGNVKLSSARSQEDFGARLKNLARQSALTGEVQTEGANQRGVASGGSLQAAAAIRRRNLERDEEPIRTGIARTIEDEGRALENIGTLEDRLLEDVNKSRRRTRQATRQARRGIRKDYKRGRRDRRRARSLQEAEQEERRQDAEVAAEYQAGKLRPNRRR